MVARSLLGAARRRGCCGQVGIASTAWLVGSAAPVVVASMRASLLLAIRLGCCSAPEPAVVGFGRASASGGAAGTVVHVTTLADSGPGSMRSAVSVGNRTVVFDVAGWVVLESECHVSSDITIDGSLTPSPGIGVMAGSLSLAGSSNVIIRHMRLRQGLRDPDKGKSAINLGKTSRVVLDHCSIAYGRWDSIDAVGAVNFTVQHSLIASPVTQQFGAHVEGGPGTFYRNVWVNVHNRQPLARADIQFINNVIYDYQAGYTCAGTSKSFKHDIVGNIFIPGPATTSANDKYFQIDAHQSVYASGNLATVHKGSVAGAVPANKAGSAQPLSEPWAGSTSSIPTVSATDAVDLVLAGAGAAPRDLVDEFWIKQVRSLGLIGRLYKNESDTGLPNGGYGDL